MAVVALAIGLYAFVLAAGLAEHPGPACHLKSRTHCAICALLSSPGDQLGLGRTIVPMPVVALVGPDAPKHALTGTRPLQSNRAPPAC